MEDGSGGMEGSTTAEIFAMLQANRDPESNWEVDVAKSLEEYLLKICSGGDFNFADAALLLQGSVQVYSRKVEYLYSLVLHALEFLSQNKKDQQEKGNAENNENDPSTAASKEDDDMFVGLDDVPAESRITLDNNLDRDDLPRKIVRPPANLLVFEDGMSDSEATELDSYLLATSGFYGDFLLLDPRDASAVFDLLQGKTSGKDDILAHTSGSALSNTRNTSPSVRSGGTACRETPGKVQEDLDPTQETNRPIEHGSPGANLSQPDDEETGCPVPGDDSDDDYFSKLLDMHQPSSSLKIKPYKRVKGFARKVIGAPKKKTFASIFPIAKIDGIVSPELTKPENPHASESVSLYEKLRMSFETWEEKCHDFGDSEDDNQHYDMDIEYPKKESLVGKSIEDLCRSHLDLLLASIAEAKQQTELDARVSTWKERIEHALEEQDRNAHFDVELYGEQILDKLSSRTDTGTASFSEIVYCLTKDEVAKVFCALLQLVAGRVVDLDKGQVMNELVCYTAANPFKVKLIGHKRREEMETCFGSNKRVKVSSTKLL